MALGITEVQLDYLGKTMRLLDNKGQINLLFDGYYNNEIRGECNYYEKNFTRYVRLEKEPFIIHIQCKGRNSYHIEITTIYGEIIKWSNPTTLENLKGLVEVLKLPSIMLKSILFKSVQEHRNFNSEGETYYDK